MEKEPILCLHCGCQLFEGNIMCPDCLRPNPFYKPREETDLIRCQEEKRELKKYKDQLTRYQCETEKLSKLKQEQSQTEDEIVQIKEKIEIYKERLNKITKALSNNQGSKLNAEMEYLKKQLGVVREKQREREQEQKNMKPNTYGIAESVIEKIIVGLIVAFLSSIPLLFFDHYILSIVIYGIAMIPALLEEYGVSPYITKRINAKKEAKYISQLKGLNQNVKLLLEQNPDIIKSKDTLESEKEESTQMLETLKRQLQEKETSLDNYNWQIKKKSIDVDHIYSDLLVLQTQLLLQGEEIEQLTDKQEKTKKLGEYPKGGK